MQKTLCFSIKSNNDNNYGIAKTHTTKNVLSVQTITFIFPYPNGEHFIMPAIACQHFYAMSRKNINIYPSFPLQQWGHTDPVVALHAAGASGSYLLRLHHLALGVDVLLTRDASVLAHHSLPLVRPLLPTFGAQQRRPQLVRRGGGNGSGGGGGRAGDGRRRRKLRRPLHRHRNPPRCLTGFNRNGETIQSRSYCPSVTCKLCHTMSSFPYDLQQQLYEDATSLEV